MADVSLPVIRARRSPGTAIAAMMLMIATTINSSINVNPCSALPLIISCSPQSVTHSTKPHRGHAARELAHLEPEFRHCRRGLTKQPEYQLACPSCDRM